MDLMKIDNNFKDKEKLYAVNDEAFPDEERISSEKLINFSLNLNCDFWGIYDDDNEFTGFIVVLPDKELKIAYIWFLAIDSKYRSKGLGGKTLQEIRTNFGMTYFGVDYEILCNDKNFNDKDFQTFISKIKLKGFRPKIYTIKE